MLAGAWYGFEEFRERLVFIKETDARIAAPLVTVSARVEGMVTALEVEEGHRVESGATVARLDARRASLELERLAVRLDAVGAERDRLGAERAMVANQMRTQLAARSSGVEAARAVVRSLAPQLENARRERDRALRLQSEGVVSKQALDRALNAMYAMEGDYLEAVARQAEAESQRAEVMAATGRLEVVDKEIAKLVHDESLLRVQIQRHRIEVQDRDVTTPIDGIVDRLFVEVGEYVRAGQRLALIHDPSAVRVDANIKETELDRLSSGQKVDVHVDAFPDERFTGIVERIGHSTTGTYSLLPNPNPSGNFTKITQRVPIRITLAEPDPRLRPGMMVEVHIHTRQPGS